MVHDARPGGGTDKRAWSPMASLSVERVHTDNGERKTVNGERFTVNPTEAGKP
jgi:hypothetical protein